MPMEHIHCVETNLFSRFLHQPPRLGEKANRAFYYMHVQKVVLQYIT